MEKFKFRLNVNDETKDIIFTAELNRDLYVVSWKKDGLLHTTVYNKQEVKEIIEKGGWIVLD